MDISKLFSKSHERVYPNGQILLYQGERSVNVYRITTGHVKVYDVTADGDEKLLLILGPGDLFPLVWTFKREGSLHYFYEAIDEVYLSVKKRSDVIKEIKKSHSLTTHLLEYFVERTNDLMLRIECIEASSAKHKVAQVLSYLASAHGDEIANCVFKIRIPITHQMIADMSGLNRSTASTNMKELSDAKMFKDTANGGFLVHTDRIEEYLDSDS